jgi:3-oxoacyl-(acyl-carrier-protein) synthase
MNLDRPMDSAKPAASQVAVVGMGIAVPRADSPEAFWNLLNEGQPVFSEPGDRYSLDAFWSADQHAEDRAYARTSGFLTGLHPHPRLAAEITEGRFSPRDRETVWLRHCLLQARDHLVVRDGDRHALLVGGSIVASQRLDEAIVTEAVAWNVAARLSACDPSPSLTDVARLRARMSQHFGGRTDDPGRLLPDRMIRSAAAGLLPADADVIIVDAACASSLYSVDLGMKLLTQGRCDIAYCGGVFSVTPRYNVTFSKLGGLTRTGRVRSFDQAADGTLFSDGSAIVALKTLDRALDDGDPVLGVIAGFGASSDGRGKAIFAANPAGQIRCVQRARDAAGLTAADIDWVICHGTGTPAGDATELDALASGAPAGGLVCASNKPLIGHTGWSAGVVSVIHALLTIEHRRIPAQHGFVRGPEGSPVGDSIIIATSEDSPAGRADRAGKPTVAVSSFGFGGTNAHLLIQGDPGRGTARNTGPGQQDRIVLVAWSAHLPGDPDRAEIRRSISGVWTGPRDFGAEYPIPPFEESRLPARTARVLDRGQLMALRLAARFVAEYGELWAPVRDTTGVVAAQTGLPPGSVDNLLRCYAADLQAAFTQDDEAKALDAFLADVCSATPPTGKDTLPGITPSILASRLASRYDLHGPAMLVDTGPTSGHTALQVASLYLHAGDMDMALVLGVSTVTRPGLAPLIGADPASHTEGAFLLALTRESLARVHGWTVLTTVDDTPRHRPDSPDASGAHATFLAADGLVELIRGLP